MTSYPYFFTWTAQNQRAPVTLRGGRGCVFETDHGEVLDLGSLTYQANLGHGHPRMVRALQAQAARLCLSMPQAVYPEKSMLAESLLSRVGDRYRKVFFCLGGAEANEHALKIARLFTGRFKAVSRYRSYHGATMGALTLTGDWRRPQLEPGVAGVVHVLDLDGPPKEGAQSFIPRTLELEQNVAAVFVEPVVGGNGVLIPTAAYYQEVQAACRDHGALLVVDEVLTGFGRTGKWFGFQHFGLEPDLITLGKALTAGYGVLGAVLVHERVASHFDAKPLISGLTHYAHPLGVAAALEAQHIYDEEALPQRAQQLEAVLLKQLTQLASEFPFLGDVRCVGLLAAVDASLSADLWSRLRGALMDERVHLHLNPHVGALILAPPLCISEAEIEDGLQRIRRALARVAS